MSGLQEAVIHARGLVKRYGSFQALHGIDLVIGRGEVFGFIGPSGAGKTTLIRTMLDLIRPSEGEIRVFGLDSRRDSRRIHARTGYVPGELGLWEKLTARQVCVHLAGLRGGDGADRIEGLAERLRLTLDRPIRELSKGNKEKVGLIQAFMHDPDLLVLDEPTGGLDPLIQHEVFTMIDETKARGATVFFSSHYLSEVERIADRVGIVREGRMAATDTIAGLKARAPRRIEVTLREAVDPAEFERIEGVSEARASDGRLTVIASGAMDEIVKSLAKHPIVTLSTPEPELEEIFLGLYEEHSPGQPQADRRATMLRSVLGRGLFEQRRALVGWSLGLAALVVIVFLYYPSIRDDPAITDFYEDLPDVAQALSGVVGIDIASPSGYLSSQLFANLVPIMFIIYGVILGSAAIGREEDRKTAELLFTAPISRRRVVAEKALAGAAVVTGLGIALFASLLLGRLLVDMEISAVNLLAASVGSILVGTTFGAVALAVSCGLGRRAHPGAGAGALAFASFLIYSLAPVVTSLQEWQKASPFYWYLHSDPLGTGFHLGDLAVLAGMSVVPAVLAAELFDRRDVTS